MYHRALLLVLLLTSSILSAAERKNFLLIYADDLDPRLGCYGDTFAKTPHIDRLADRGVRFNHAYCQLPTCGPSRASMLTGLYPWKTGITGNRHNVREVLPDVVTLPQLLKQSGYQTVRVGKIYHMGIPSGIGGPGGDDPLSWSVTVNNTGWDGDEENLKQVHRHGTGWGLGVALGWLGPDVPDWEIADGAGTLEAIHAMEHYHPGKTGKPLMLAVGYYRPHPPMVAPKKYFDMYPLDSIRLPAVPANDRHDIPEPAFELKEPDHNFVPESVAKNYTRGRYASVSFVDAQVGMLLDALERNNLRDDTVIVFVGDQGFHLGEHNHWHKTTLFEEGTRVPLIISKPRMKTAGKASDVMVELVDVYPTVCDLLGLEMPHESAAKSLVPQLEDVGRPGKEAAVTMVRHPRSFSIRTARYRYTEWNAGDDGVELYDHRTDPREHTNLARDPAHAAKVRELRALLHDWIR